MITYMIVAVNVAEMVVSEGIVFVRRNTLLQILLHYRGNYCDITTAIF